MIQVANILYIKAEIAVCQRHRSCIKIPEISNEKKNLPKSTEELEKEVLDRSNLSLVKKKSLKMSHESQLNLTFI